jgi:transposase
LVQRVLLQRGQSPSSATIQGNETGGDRMKRAPSHEIKGPGGILPLRADDEAVVDLVMLIEGETSGRDLEQVLRQFGRSRSTYYEKLRRFREQGVEGLLSRPPGPRSPWRRPLEVVRYIVTTRLRHPDRPAGAIAADIARMGHEVSVRSVERTLSQFGLTRPPSRQALAAAAPSAPASVAGAAAPPPISSAPGTPAAPPPQRAPDDRATE